MTRLVPFALLLLLTSCATFSAQPVALQKAETDALGCLTSSVATEVAKLSPAVLDALAGDSPDWQAQLSGLEVTGENVLVCAVSHALYDALGGGIASLAEAEHRAELLLAQAGPGSPVPPVHQRVLARGLEYLRLKLPASAK